MSKVCRYSERYHSCFIYIIIVMWALQCFHDRLYKLEDSFSSVFNLTITHISQVRVYLKLGVSQIGVNRLEGNFDELLFGILISTTPQIIVCQWWEILC